MALHRIPHFPCYSTHLTPALQGMGLRPVMRQKALSVTLLRHPAGRRTDRLDMRLLVVEDNEGLARLLAKGLEEFPVSARTWPLRPPRPAQS
jgi:hypothetical protein